MNSGFDEFGVAEGAAREKNERAYLHKTMS